MVTASEAREVEGRRDCSNRLLGSAGGRPSPLQIQLPLRSRTVSQVEIDERLVRNPGFLGELLEVVHGWRVQADGYALLEALRVGVLSGFRKIVFCSHGLR